MIRNFYFIIAIAQVSIALLNETTPSGWMSYSYNYTATKMLPTLLFGFETDSTHTYYLDAMSVVYTNASLTELLTDPSFETFQQ